MKIKFFEVYFPIEKVSVLNKNSIREEFNMSKILIKKFLKKNIKIYWIFLQVFSKFFNKKIEENLNTNKILQEYSPKPLEKTYVYKNNVVSEEYDLQIIIPAYNVEKYIEECLDSVFNQKTKYKILVIVVNDGSTDSTFSKILKYQKFKNLKIINSSNGGLSSARNLGLEKIYAKYIMFLDSDDYICQDSIEKLLDEAYRKNYDIVEGTYLRVTDSKKILYKLKHEKENENKNKLRGFAWGKVIKNKVFKEIRFPLNYYYEDSIFSWLIYPKGYYFTTIEDNIYMYRLNHSSITNIIKTNNRNIETWYITKEMIENGLKLYNISINEKLYLQFLHQIKLNYIRTMNNPEIIKKSIFIETLEIYEKNFKQYDDKNLELTAIDKILEESLKEKNYGKYKFICRYGREV